MRASLKARSTLQIVVCAKKLTCIRMIMELYARVRVQFRGMLWTLCLEPGLLKLAVRTVLTTVALHSYVGKGRR